MKTIKVEIWDTIGNRKQLAEIPANVASQSIVSTLIRKMGLPLTGPGGQVSYKLHHRESSKQLGDIETLAEANVQEGDVLRLQAEMTAGDY
jgi:hypothetical protein